MANLGRDRAQDNEGMRSKTCSTLLLPNSQLPVNQKEERHVRQKRRSNRETPKDRFSVYFHTFLYGALTIACVEELIRTNHISMQLMGFWLAEASYIGVPAIKNHLVDLIRGSN